MMLPASAGISPRVEKNAFDDLLSGQGFQSSNKSNQPTSLKDMRNKELEQTMDPVKLKVAFWKLVNLVVFLMLNPITTHCGLTSHFEFVYTSNYLLCSPVIHFQSQPDMDILLD